MIPADIRNQAIRDRVLSPLPSSLRFEADYDYIGERDGRAAFQHRAGGEVIQDPPTAVHVPGAQPPFIKTSTED